MRRLIALLVMLALAAATAAPAIAACRMRGAQKECCCGPAPSNSFCAPDCCDTAKPARPIADATANLRCFMFVAHLPIAVPLAHSEPARPDSAPMTRALVRLHERASPRLPLRI